MSLSVALIIAVYFPAVHDQIVTRATRLEYQSLYWGTVAISNVFTYGLLFLCGRAVTIFFSFDLTNNKTVAIVLSIQEVCIYVILFLGSLFALLMRDNHLDITIPNKVIRFLMNISFFGFLPCVHVSKKTIKLLVSLSLMNFVYHNVMDFVSLGFIMFLGQVIPIVLISTILYISSGVFLVFAVSFSFFHLFHMLHQKKPPKFIKIVCNHADWFCWGNLYNHHVYGTICYIYPKWIECGCICSVTNGCSIWWFMVYEEEIPAISS